MPDLLIKDRVVEFDAHGRVFGIMTEPVNRCGSSLPVLLLNAGFIHKVGPNRLYVRLARALARKGHSVLRYDPPGFGNSVGGDASSVKRSGDAELASCRSALDFLLQEAGSTRAVIGGLCAGAHLAVRAAQWDPRISTALLVEGDYPVGVRYHISRATSLSKWSRLLRRRRSVGGAEITEAADVLPADSSSRRLRKRFRRNLEQRAALDTILGRGSRVLMFFRAGNEVHHEFALEEERGPVRFARGLPSGLSVAFVKYADHTFTPLLSQQYLVDCVTSMLLEGRPQ